jgi:hypothetical protein
LEAYRAAKRGNSGNTRLALEAFRDASDFTLRGPFAEEMGFGGREMEGIRELPHAIHRYIQITHETPVRKRTSSGTAKPKDIEF